MLNVHKALEYIEDLEVSSSDESDFEDEFVSLSLFERKVKKQNCYVNKLYTCCCLTHLGNMNILRIFEFSNTNNEANSISVYCVSLFLWYFQT